MTLLRQSFPYLFPDSVIRHSKKVTITVTSYELINEPIEELKANADLIASNPVPVSVSPDISFEHLSNFFEGYITKSDKAAHGWQGRDLGYCFSSLTYKPFDLIKVTPQSVLERFASPYQIDRFK